VGEGAVPAWHLFVVRSQERDDLQKRLTEAGIDTLIHYPIPPHLQGAYSEIGHDEGSFPLAEIISREVLSLPIGPHLSSEEVQRVISAIV
jgi:dTDP-4-amino-4,6-dideoxygalactose transaminase